MSMGELIIIANIYIMYNCTKILLHKKKTITFVKSDKNPNLHLVICAN